MGAKKKKRGPENHPKQTRQKTLICTPTGLPPESIASPTWQVSRTPDAHPFFLAPLEGQKTNATPGLLCKRLSTKNRQVSIGKFIHDRLLRYLPKSICPQRLSERHWRKHRSGAQPDHGCRCGSRKQQSSPYENSPSSKFELSGVEFMLTPL